MKIIKNEVYVTDEYVNLFLKSVAIEPARKEKETFVYTITNDFIRSIEQGQLVMKQMRDNVLKTGRRLG